MSVKERNGKFVIELLLGVDNKGKKIRYYETFEGSLKQARLRESELKIQLKEGNLFKKSNITLENLSKEYMEIQRDKLSPKTYITYEQRIKIINEKIGNIRLKDLNVRILEKFYSYLKNEFISERTGKPISNTTIQHYYCVLNNMLEQAVKWDYIKKNYNSKIDKPKRDRKEIEVFSKEEVIQLLECLKNEPLKYQALIYLALDLGCREGELTGLIWEDIDFNTREVTINKTTQVIKGQIIEKETKSVNSDRKVYITKTTLNILKEYRKEQMKKKLLLGSKWENSKRVFTTETGRDIHHDTPYSIFKKILRKYGLKDIKFHALRHTNASLKISEGIQPQIISRSLGHSSVQITDKYYSHFFEDEFKDMSNTLENSIFSKVN